MEGRAMHYSMIIQWEPVGGVYVVTVPELEGCVTHGSTYEEAVQQGQEVIDTWIMAAVADGEELPAPNFYPLDGEDITATREGESSPRAS